MKNRKKYLNALRQAHSDLNGKMDKTSSAIEIAKRNEDFAQLTTDEQCEVLFYRMHFDVEASTQECLDRRVAYIYKDSIGIIEPRTREATEFFAHVNLLISLGLSNWMHDQEIVRVANFSVVKTPRVGVVYLTS